MTTPNGAPNGAVPQEADSTVATYGVASENGPTRTDTTKIPDSNASTDTDDHGGNREAAAWRRKLRDAQQEFDQQRAQLEGERDQLRDQLAAVQRGVITDITGAHGIDMRLLEAAGCSLDGFVNEDGSVNHLAVAQACREVGAEFRVRRTVLPNRQQGTAGGQPQRTDAWKAAFAPPQLLR